MDDKELEIEREKTKQKKYKTILWIVFWSLLLGGEIVIKVTRIVTQ